MNESLKLKQNTLKKSISVVKTVFVRNYSIWSVRSLELNLATNQRAFNETMDSFKLKVNWIFDEMKVYRTVLRIIEIKINES